MPRTYKITMENAAEIRVEMRKEKNKNLYRRMEAVALRGEGKGNDEIAAITKYNAKYVSQLVSLYAKKGLNALREEGRKGGNRRNLSVEQERELLEGFRKEAEKGHVITPAEIKAAYDTLAGKETKDTFIYTVLRRNKWRMVMPRSQHPKKASDEEIESSKKLTKQYEMPFAI
jgi:transposase